MRLGELPPPRRRPSSRLTWAKVGDRHVVDAPRERPLRGLGLRGVLRRARRRPEAARASGRVREPEHRRHVPRLALAVVRRDVDAEAEEEPVDGADGREREERDRVRGVLHEELGQQHGEAVAELPAGVHEAERHAEAAGLLREALDGDADQRVEDARADAVERLRRKERVLVGRLPREDGECPAAEAAEGHAAEHHGLDAQAGTDLAHGEARERLEAEVDRHR
eukprot:CAMPEP_0119289954 /NCGR_PEP_ID=MMETSP1329-20130426/39916_1 /TAXON_ID=114041 /ORGANISM="Genus nov. species nov., Strain RCC1024" /LENGTH=223 /DNA_ID=CAMNT_0007290769 /DNA_START=12 /DNA_END=680 /DNA_ORIENTATION=+